MITAIEIVQQHITPLEHVPVVSHVPTSRPDLFVRVDQGAPRMINPITEESFIAVQVYGLELEEVIGLAQRIRVLLWDVDALDLRIQSWSESEGPHDYPDPDIPHVHRWQLAGVLSFTHT